MIPSVMHAVTARHFRSQKAILRDYARFRVKGESYPGIIPVTDAITEGIIYFNVNEFSLEQLDTFEGDLYERIRVRVENREKEMIDAQAYVIQSKYLGYLSMKAWDVKEFIKKDLEMFLMTYSGFPKNV
ncbi:MAG: gamma-glutamylcyclotransferase [Deltaproteobacteria bacterium]|nr:gamma-glutamylcyclotransferase [Deltaproteobacteria bacterium]